MRYDLVFEGGGARGIAFLGALQELEARGHTFGRLLGTSAGAIVATLLAAGYTPGELLAALDQREGDASVFQTFLAPPEPFSRDEIQNSTLRAFFRDVDWAFVPNIVEDKLDDALATTLLRFPVHRNLMAYLERGGWFSADRFVGWLYERLNSGYVNGAPRRFGDMSLRQLFEATGVELSMVVTDTTAARMRVLNHHTAPNCPVVWAVRMSMNLPFVWPDVVWLHSWGLYLGGSLAGNVMLDGGLLSGFPLELFVSREPYVQALMGKPTGDAVLGLLIDEKMRIPNAPDDAPPPNGGLDLASLRAVERITRMVNTMTSARDKMILEAFEQSVVRLPAKGYGTLEFTMMPERRARLLEGGRGAVRLYFDRPRAADTRDSERDAANAINHANRRALEMLAPEGSNQ